MYAVKPRLNPLSSIWLVSIYMLVVAVYFIALHSFSFITPELFHERWIIMPVSFVAAFFANATAVGGGFLFVPLFIVFFGLPVDTTLKLSLATQAFGMTSGSIGWSMDNIDRQMLLLGAMFGVLGVYFGTYFVEIDGQTVKLVFILASVLVLVSLIFARHNQQNGKDIPVQIRSLGLRYGSYVLLCTVGGVITAKAAIGIGELVVVALMVIFGSRSEVAIGTGVAILAVCSVAATLMHNELGDIPFDYLIFTAPGVILGGFTGARYGKHLNKHETDNGSPLVRLLVVVIAVDIVVMGLVLVI